ncbi:hemagglutinin repeat-containing protein [Veillonella parvula]|uniref:hemagglutinin repeat-containing protein n=1 Tax=Veillonella parvula TaxID=29466 RepID=UPI0036F391D3
MGVNISVADGGILGFDASANAAKQKGNIKAATHTGTTVVDSDDVAITSEKDTHISGSLRNLDNNGSVEALIRILENGVTLSYIQEAENPSFRKNADGSYAVRAEGKMYYLR